MVRYIFRLIPLVFSIIFNFFSVLGESAEQLEFDIAEQPVRIAALEEAYANGEIPPVDESAFFDGDLAAELEAGIKFNEIAFIATHNSYQKKSTPAMCKLYGNLDELTFGLLNANTGEFESQTLTQQFNCGIRSIEMDIEVIEKDGNVTFTCLHNPSIDMTTTCYNFALALKEISMWSDNNPNHLPITIIIEPKETFLPIENMKFFNTDYAVQLDALLKDCLGDKLFTPADMLRGYSSFGEMRAADDWCKVKDMLGKVLVLMHENNVTEKYIALDPSVKTQAMFPMLRTQDIGRDCASFLLMNKPEEILDSKAEILDNGNFIVRTRADKYGEITENRLNNAISSGAQIVSTDYPPRDDLDEKAYVVCFQNNKTVRIVK